MATFTIEHRSSSELKPDARNAGTDGPKQIAEIAASIKAFGFNNPGLLSE